KLRREALPAPEDLPFTAELARKRPTGVWFKVNVGRKRNADPRWLLPILCRRGEVDRKQIGRIEIMPDETRFEVSRAAAAHFGRAAKKPDRKDPNIRITQVHE